MSDLVAAADGVVEDDIAYPLMLRMVSCLGDALEERGLPAGCFLGLVPGDSQYLACGECEDGKCGSAWVRLASEYPTTNFPDQDVAAAKCGSRMAYRIEVGVLRCVPTIMPDGSGPDVAEQLETTRIQLADKAAIRSAISCCLRGFTLKGKPLSYVLGAYQPTPFQGGCGGGFWEVTVGGPV